MKKYYIEGNLDFYEELYKSLDKEETDENVCLITNFPLKDRYVQLECGHKFNYDALYNDLVKFKTKFNHMEKPGQRLERNEIRCPYCRHKQKEILPYYSDMPFKKVKGVNCLFDDIQPSSQSVKRCEFYYSTHNENGEEQPKKIQCCKSGYLLTSMTHHIHNYIIANNFVMPENDKYYCYMHSRIAIKEYAKQQKALQKQKIKEIKNADKQKEKEAKQAERELKKAEKKKEKEAMQKMKKQMLENELSNETNDVVQIDIDKCAEILKSGANKGQKCGQSVFNECLCKRHYNLKNKDKNNDK